MTLLIGGGADDPQLQHLRERAEERGLDVLAVCIGPAHHPAVAVELDGRLRVDGRLVHPTAAFLRRDVFSAQRDPRAAVSQRATSWHATLKGWLDLAPEVRAFNRDARHGGGQKLADLGRAKAAGLLVPETLVTNDAARLDALDPALWVAKPIGGGSACLPLDVALREAPRRRGSLAAPAIVQARLVAPEIRVYVVGERLRPFTIQSSQLDYRTDRAAQVNERPPLPEPVAAGLLRLAASLGLTWAAADLKCLPDGRMVFLEINTAPMFAAFDRAASGALCDDMLTWLTTSP